MPQPCLPTFARLARLASLALALAASAAHADSKDLTVSHPWVRATVAGQPVAGGFLSISNSGQADRLVSAQAEVSATVELHTMRMEGDVMKMRKLDAGIDLPAGKTIDLKPGGLHIMFIDLKAPLKAGDTVPVRLKFEKAGEVLVQMPVQAEGQHDMAGGHDHQHHKD